MIAHLKDQLQEMKAKTTMESKYIKKVTFYRSSIIIDIKLYIFN